MFIRVIPKAGFIPTFSNAHLCDSNYAQKQRIAAIALQLSNVSTAEARTIRHIQKAYSTHHNDARQVRSEL
ncbi:hypothetical protein SAMN02745866_01371 [Alteromonadaceae bacterium Bs31]|nr:hypothetical protein SAMN02745866_01371 [Alteromonadaceae bacterium Bs31]